MSAFPPLERAAEISKRPSSFSRIADGGGATEADRTHVKSAKEQGVPVKC